MFEHYMFGIMQANPGRRKSSELSPREVAAAGEQCAQSQCPPPPLSARPRDDSKSAPDSVESLAQELSRQNLQLDRANLEQLQLQLSSPSLSPRPPYMSSIPLCPELEIDDEPPPRLDSRSRRQALPALSLTMPPCPMDLDQRPVAPDMKRLSRQRSSQFNNDPNNSRTIQTLVEDMIASGSQCNVHRASQPPLTPTSPNTLGPGDGVKVDVDCMHLQVDDAYANGLTLDAEKEEALLMKTMMSLRRAGAPSGVRKIGLLQYRASADAAFNCVNVVRSRPRMRKRGRTHRGSKAYSIISSAFSSPVIPPSITDEMRIPLGQL